jgi:hypothetical protein
MGTYFKIQQCLFGISCKRTALDSINKFVGYLVGKKFKKSVCPEVEPAGMLLLVIFLVCQGSFFYSLRQMKTNTNRLPDRFVKIILTPGCQATTL